MVNGDAGLDHEHSDAVADPLTVVDPQETIPLGSKNEQPGTTGLAISRDGKDVTEPVRGKSHPMLIVVMGVSGCGKSTLGQALASALGLPFIDGDSLHPQANIDKMSKGIPLDDDDRKPWLELIRTRAEGVAAEQRHYQARPDSVSAEVDGKLDSEEGKEESRIPHGLVVACSSLKARYRAILRGHEPPSELTSSGPVNKPNLTPPPADHLPTYFVYIKGSKSALTERMAARKGHFMKVEMLESQLATLESPEGEDGVVTVGLEDHTETQVAQAVKGLRGFVGEGEASHEG